jgi:hypothetical protein
MAPRAASRSQLTPSAIMAFGVRYVEPLCRSSGSILNSLVYLPPAQRVKKTPLHFQTLNLDDKGIWIYIRRMNDPLHSTRSDRAPGVFAIGILCLFGSIISSLVGLSLVSPGAMLDRIWTLTPHAHSVLAPFGKIVGIVLFLVSIALAGALRDGWLAPLKEVRLHRPTSR